MHTLMLDLSVEEGQTNKSYHLLSNGWKSIMLPLHCIMCPCVHYYERITKGGYFMNRWVGYPNEEGPILKDWRI